MNWHDFFNLEITSDLLQREFVQQALLACILLGLLGGLLGPLIVARGMSFAVHGASELSVTGAAAALLAGVNVQYGGIAGAVVASLLFGLLGTRVNERDSVIGVVMAFGLGVGVLFMSWYGRTGESFALLTGQVVSVGMRGVWVTVITAVVVTVVLALTYRPLLFASTDQRMAAASGLPMRFLSVLFAVLMGAAVAQAVQIIGALLVMSLMITPAAAAVMVTTSPVRVVGLSVLFAEISAVVGIIVSLAPGLPVSFCVTTLSFAIYVGCRVVRYRRSTRKARPPLVAAAA